MAIEKIIAVNNLEKVVENKDVSTTAALDVTMANAYIESKEASEHVADVIGQLEEQAVEQIEDSSAQETPIVNIYTRMNLDESLKDFELSDVSPIDEDDYLDYDMFHFVYGLVADDWPKPKNPLDHRMRKFQHTGSDDYLKTNSNVGTSQVSTTYDDDVVVYADDVEAFNDIREVCDYYHIEYSDVQPRRSRSSHWAFNMTIYVPKTAQGYPMMAEDFFEQYGLSLEDVIEDHKVGKGQSANWGRTYKKKVDKDRNDAQNDAAVEKVYDKYYKQAAWSNDPLNSFIKAMFNELDEQGLKYKKSELKKRFIDDFNDDFEDAE